MTELTVALLYDLLDVDPDDGPRALVRAARRAVVTLPPLVFSLLEREGTALGPLARAELDLARRKAERYDELVADLPAGARLVKGPLLAGLFPHGVRRPVGDVDVVAADEEAMWRVVRYVRERVPVSDMGYAVMDAGGRRHHVVTLEWPAEDELCDLMKVEVATAAVTGDFGAVPPFTALPVNDLVAHLLVLAERGLSQDFGVRDAVDTIVLLANGLLESDELLPAVVAAKLAPEVSGLFAHVREHTGDETLAHWEEQLAAPAKDELSRRSAHRSEVDRECPDLEQRLSAGLPVFGMFLGWAAEPGRSAATEFRRFDRGTLALTPEADYLLVGGALVDPELYDAALVAAR